MDIMVLASFVAFFALVLAWLVAPSADVKQPVVMAGAGAAD